jgi:hypothetical protein
MRSAFTPSHGKDEHLCTVQDARETGPNFISHRVQWRVMYTNFRVGNWKVQKCFCDLVLRISPSSRRVKFPAIPLGNYPSMPSMRIARFPSNFSGELRVLVGLPTKFSVIPF